MILSNIINLDNNVMSMDCKNQSIFNFNLNVKNTKIFTLPGTNFSEEIPLIYVDMPLFELEKANLVILSEPSSPVMDEEDLVCFVEKYKEIAKTAFERGIPTVHLTTNSMWFALFNKTLKEYSIPIYLTNHDYSLLKGMLDNVDFHIIEDFFYLKNLHYYSNELNNNLLIDLTAYQNNNNFYSQTINSILDTVDYFENVSILISNDSYFPEVNNDKVTILKDDKLLKLECYTYVLVLNNSPYDSTDISKVMYYAANSKVVFTNYNFKINNMIPSVILNLSDHLDFVKPLSKVDAFDIINENRNTILYKHTSLNFLDKIYKNIFNENLIEPLLINNTLEYFEGNIFIQESEENNSSLNIKDYKYDIEHTLALPLIFLGQDNVRYKNSFISNLNVSNNIFTITTPIEKENTNQSNVDNKVSVIVPIHNNGKYLKYKCFRSLKTLTRFNEMEIIFIDDGSSDSETLRIIDDILYTNKDIVFKKYVNGSGSASRPRNEGVYVASTDLITYLDPDNETIDDGHSILLTAMLDDESLDMVVGDIVREDNVKRNVIKYSQKVQKAIKTNIFEDTKDTLIETKLTVQSIQGLIVRKDVILDNNITMVEGAAGQDTLYFQELLLSCKKVKVINQMIHSYYAFVEGSVTNTVSHRFFEKFYKVEQERIKFLIEEGLIEYYMKIKFNFYFKNWYLKKYIQVPEYDKEKSFEYLKKIVYLYKDYSSFIDAEIKEFIEV